MVGTNNAANHQTTQYNVLTGGASNLINNVAPSATSGVPVISQGASSQPVFGTAVVAGGGTGATSLTGILTGNGTSAVTANAVTNHGVLIGGASNAASSLSVASTGTVLTGVTGSDPAFSATPTVTSITFGSGSALGNYVATTSWTPTIIGSGTAGTASYSIQVGQYVRIGSLVYVMFSMAWTGGTGTGNLLVTGLPVAPVSTANWRPAGTVQLGSSLAPPATTVDVQIVIAGDASASNIFVQATIATGVVSNVAYAASGAILGSIWYFV
jgi:hypothetical protein